VFGAVLVVQLVILYWPRAVQPSGGLPWDKIVHALIFGLVMYTGVRAGLPLRAWLAVTVAHAGLSEALQHWLLPHRSGDVWDAAADAAGAVVAAFLVRPRGAATSSGVRNPADEVPHARE
jgi:VanZ family protein